MPTFRPHVVLLSLAIFLFFSASDAAPTEAHWSQFRGARGTGLAEAAAKPPSTFDTGSNLAWERRLAAGCSSPCVWGDRVFVTGYARAKQELFLSAIRLSDGKVLWRRVQPCEQVEKVHRSSSPATATPVADGERVYVYFGSAGLFCYDFDGNERWTLELPMPRTRNGSGTSPVLAADRLILNRDGAPERCLMALDPATGTEIWKQDHKSMFGGQAESYSTPLVVDNEIIIHRSGEIAAFRLEDGKRLWWVSAATTGCSSPALTKDGVVVATWNNAGEPDLRSEIPKFATVLKEHDTDGDGKLSKDELPADASFTTRPEAGEARGGEILIRFVFPQLDINKDQKLGSFEWATMATMFKFMAKDHGLLAIRRGGTGNVTRTHVSWTQARFVPEVPSPVVLDGYVYSVKNGGIVMCLDEKTGKQVYRKRLGATGSYYASPVAANGKIYFVSEPGVITVVKAGKSFEVESRFDLEQSVKTTPAIAGETFLIRTKSRLLAFRGS